MVLVRKVPLLVCVVAGALVLPGVLGGQVRQSGEPELSGELASVRSALDKYRDPLAAVRDGFLSTLSCIDFPAGGVDGETAFKPGAMGVHFVNMGNVGPTLDPAKPQVLIYEPAGDSLRLVAAEWFMPAQLVKEGEHPQIFGQRMQGPMPGHEPIMPAALRHYDLHVWLWRENPHGVFSTTNGAMQCPKTRYSHFEKGAAHKH